MSRRRWTAAVVVAGALTLASCGGGDSRRLSEDELVARANRLCAQHTHQIVAAAQSRFPSREVPAAGALVDFAQQTVVPEAEKLVDRLESLNPPEDEEEEFEEYIDEANRAVEKMKGGAFHGLQ